MNDIELKEKRMEEIAAIVQMNGGASVNYGGKQCHLARGWKHAGSAFTMEIGGNLQGSTDEASEQAGAWELPETIVHLDECLNILNVESRIGRAVAQQTVYDILDRMIEESAKSTHHNGKMF